jgi:hypothetical protein
LEVLSISNQDKGIKLKIRKGTEKAYSLLILRKAARDKMETKTKIHHRTQLNDLSIGSSLSGCVIECYPPHPSSIPVSDMTKL